MRPLRVFLVDNHQDTVKYIRLYLEHLGHEVTTAGDMTTALTQVSGSDYDMLISDIRLPDGDGWQLMERLRDARPGFAVAMSGYGGAEDLLKSRAAGYDHHLVKPFVPADLVELLQKAASIVEQRERGCAPDITAEKGSDDVGLVQND